MKAEWRTPVVVALCQQMLDERDWTNLPILADALQDAGCDDKGILGHCLDEHSDIEKERVVNIIFSSETEEAVKWMEQFVRSINYHSVYDEEKEEYVEDPNDIGEPHNYEYVIRQDYEGLRGEMYYGSDQGADFFREGNHNKEEFYRNWSLITGKYIYRDDNGNRVFIKVTNPKQCPSTDFLTKSQCQGVDGHDGTHWCYHPSGSFDQWKDLDKCADTDWAVSTTPPEHKNWVHPKDMRAKHWLSFTTRENVSEDQVPEGFRKREEKDDLHED